MSGDLKPSCIPGIGERVRLMLRTISDIPYGHLGTVVGYTREDRTGETIVQFDGKPRLRYLSLEEMHRVGRGALASQPHTEDGREDA